MFSDVRCNVLTEHDSRQAPFQHPHSDIPDAPESAKLNCHYSIFPECAFFCRAQGVYRQQKRQCESDRFGCEEIKIICHYPGKHEKRAELFPLSCKNKLHGYDRYNRLNKEHPCVFQREWNIPYPRRGKRADSPDSPRVKPVLYQYKQQQPALYQH